MNENLFRFLSSATLLALLLPAGLPAFDPAAGDFTKANSSDIRVMSFNVHNNLITNTSITNNELQRLFTAINPDVIVLNEMTQGITATQIKTTLETYFPSTTWTVNRGISDGFDRCALATRNGLSMQITDTTPASEVRGVVGGLVDVAGSTDLYIMGVHLKCCTDILETHERRQIAADALINWMRDARTAGGNIDLPAGTPMVVLGDLNLGPTGRDDEPPYHATRTLLDGDIYDEVTYGSDSAPDWDGSNTADAVPYDHTNGDPDTWPSDSGTPTSRFDRQIYTDSVLRVSRRFLLNTDTMSSGALIAAGLQATDSANASDHLPSVVDYALGGDPNPPANLIVNEFSYDDAGTDNRSFLELINTGGQELNLEAPVRYRFLRSNNDAPTTPPGTENESTTAIPLTGVIPPGGLFVLYNSAADSSGISASLQSLLPALQRENSGSFSLFNGPNAAISVVTVATDYLGDESYTAVDSYLYEDTTPAAANYLLTVSANDLLITLGTGQSTGTVVSTDTQSVSRLVGDITANSFAGWAIPDAATPGLPNNTSSLEGWMLLDEK